MFLAKNISTQRKFHRARLNGIKKKKKKSLLNWKRPSTKLKRSKKMRLMKNSRIKKVRQNWIFLHVYKTSLVTLVRKIELTQRNRFRISIRLLIKTKLKHAHEANVVNDKFQLKFIEYLSSSQCLSNLVTKKKTRSIQEIAFKFKITT